MKFFGVYQHLAFLMIDPSFEFIARFATYYLVHIRTYVPKRAFYSVEITMLGVPPTTALPKSMAPGFPLLLVLFWFLSIT